uniref:Structural maintenance of chromosomes protein n=1 Tax=Panagrellus redivivus TaxID=6233 RepID=A0A7E4UL16_PANRE
MPPKGAPRRRKAALGNAGGGDNAQAPEKEAIADPVKRQERLKQLEELGDVFNVAIPSKSSVSASGNGLLISHIDIVNFKSYLGASSIGPFCRTLNCIIGPNGNGKSNVIDSLLFVFGFRSSKLRAAKLSSFIHNSSAGKAQSCSVTVHFQQFVKNADGSHTTTDYFHVCRTVDQNNKSKYYLNGHTIHFKEIFAKLKDCGVDLDHNRFLILQGEVEQISLMKPKAEREGDEGLLEYLDDIIGSNRFEEPIELFALQLELISTERDTQVSRLDMVTRDRNEMSGPVRETLQLLVLENKISAVKNKFFQTKKLKYEKEIKALGPKREAAEGDLQDKERRLEELVVKVKEQKRAINKLQKELDKHKTTTDDAEKRWNAEKLRLKQLELGFTKAKTRKEEKEKEVVKEEKKIATLTDKPAKNNEEVEGLKEELESVKAELEEAMPGLREALTKSQEKTDELNNERNKIGERLAKAKSEENKANAELTLTQSKRVAMTEDGESFKQKLEAAKTSVVDLKASLKKRETDKSTLSKRLPTIEADIKKATATIKDLSEREPALKTKYGALRAKYNAANADSHNNQQSQHALSMLMREKRNGNIPGLIGRLGNLGAVDPKYDVAISTTCSNLDVIVCDTTDTVNKCLEFIAANNLPRTTFLACEKITHFKPNMQPIKTPENTPRLFDLVQTNDENARLAFYFALRDTLITDNIANANRISTLWPQRNFRVVTLDGNVKDVGGTLTGGGQTVRRGRIGTNVQAMQGESADTILPEMNRAKAALDELQAELSQTQANVEAMTRERDQLQAELRRATQAAELESNQLDLAQTSIKELEQRIAETNIDKSELDAIDAEIIRLEGVRDKFRASAEAVKHEYDAISKRIDAVYEEVSGELQRNVDALKKKQTDAEAKIKSLRSAASKAEIDLKKSTEKVASLKKQLVTIEKEIETSEAEQARTAEDIEELSALVDEKKAQLVELQTNLENITVETSGNDEMEVNLKKEITAAKETLIKITEKCGLLEGKMGDADTKISKLNCYDIKEILAEKSLQKPSKTQAKKKQQNEDNNSDESDPESSDDDEPEEREATPAAEEANSDDPNTGKLQTYTPEVIETFDVTELEGQIGLLESERASIEVTMNLNLIEAYRTKLAECKSEVAKLNEITVRRDAVRKRLFELKRSRVEEFMLGYSQIALALKEQYQMLTLGGDADLELVDPIDPYAEGIRFTVRPRGKGWRPMQQTSGGEKTLSSLSLVFALHTFRPTPFYVMDEIDAALDARNVMLIAHFVQERSATAQFIIISLREQMFSLANRLIGIYKVNDCTRHVVTAGMEYTKSGSNTRPQPSHKAIEHNDENEVIPQREKPPKKSRKRDQVVADIQFPSPQRAPLKAASKRSRASRD